jgi:hypothetical protein
MSGEGLPTEDVKDPPDTAEPQYCGLCSRLLGTGAHDAINCGGDCWGCIRQIEHHQHESCLPSCCGECRDDVNEENQA